MKATPFLFTCLFTYSFAQTELTKENDKIILDQGSESEIFTVVETSPEYIGGIAELNKFISQNIRYPKKAKRKNIEGKVYVQFTVQKDGSVADVNVIKGVSKECDAEAIRIFQMMPKWKPGKQRGHPVKARFVYPVNFELNMKDKK